MSANEKNEKNTQLASSLGAHSVLIAGQGEMAVPVAKTLAEQGIMSFTLMSFFDEYQETTESQMIRAIRDAGYDASIRIVQASRHDLEHYLFPQETDLILDCLDNVDSPIRTQKAFHFYFKRYNRRQPISRHPRIC